MFIVKKYSPYFLEEIPRIEGGSGRYLTRNKRTVDRLRTLRQHQIEDIFGRESDKLRQEAERDYGKATFSESDM